MTVILHLIALFSWNLEHNSSVLNRRRNNHSVRIQGKYKRRQKRQIYFLYICMNLTYLPPLDWSTFITLFASYFGAIPLFSYGASTEWMHISVAFITLMNGTNRFTTTAT